MLILYSTGFAPNFNFLILFELHKILASLLSCGYNRMVYLTLDSCTSYRLKEVVGNGILSSFDHCINSLEDGVPVVRTVIGLNRSKTFLLRILFSCVGFA